MPRKRKKRSKPSTEPQPIEGGTEDAGQRSIGTWFAAISLGLIALFVLVALVTHSPSDDPPGRAVVYNGTRTNACGVVGKYLSHWLLGYLGYAAYLVFVALVFWGYLFIRGRMVKRLPWEVLGAAVVVTSICGMLAFVVETPISFYPSGGYLGVNLKDVMEPGFGYTGSMILLLLGLIAGLLLSGELYFVDTVSWIARQIGRGASLAARKAKEGGVAAVQSVGASGGEDAAVSTVTPVESAPARKPRKSSKPRKATADPTPPEDDESAAASAEAADADTAQPDSESKPRRKIPVIKPRKKVKDSPDQQELFEPSIEDKIDRPKRSYQSRYKCPGLELLDDPPAERSGLGAEHYHDQAQRLETALHEFGIEAKVVNIETGPVITMFELELAPGIKVGRVMALSDDMAMVLKAHSVRVVAPIPGKSTVGIEVPNVDKELVRMREVMESARSAMTKFDIPLFLGKDSRGGPMVMDLARLPHLLIAGRTGTGKSVCINTLILSILMTRTPDDVKMVLIDPKTVELTPYKKIPHLMSPVVINMKKAAAVLEWAENKMDERFELLHTVGVRHLNEYNALGESAIRERAGLVEGEQSDRFPFHLPYIVIIIDELADMMMVGPKEVEQSITRLAQKSRAVGIHVVLATQRPSVDVITGLIKANLPARISFQVASKIDSRTILDASGADKLCGPGDMLVLKPGTAKLMRAQATYVSDGEIERVTRAVQDIVPDFSDELVQLENTGSLKSNADPSERDDLYEDALRVVLETQRGSVSLLQRRLGIGYTRSSRLIEMIAEAGFLGEHKGSQAREVLMTLEEYEQAQAEAEAEEQNAPPPQPAAEVTVPPEEAEDTCPDESEPDDDEV